MSEIYLSVQGEGPRVGSRTVFVRFGGCNLRCPGWPCDTQHAIDPKFRKEWTKMGIEQVVHEIRVAGEGAPYNICFTGGEPFLQQHDELRVLVERMLKLAEVRYVEVFSNGALEYPLWAIRSVDFVMDWKLPGSGEAIAPQARISNVNAMRDLGHVIKFTISSREDYLNARSLCDIYGLEENFDIYYGTVWGKLENSELISWVLEDNLTWKFTMQVHNHVWDRSKRGI